LASSSAPKANSSLLLAAIRRRLALLA
jgi:hypothetical protein